MAEVQEAVATTLSALGGIVCVDGRAGEIINTGIADGTSVAGWAVWIEGTLGADTGKMVGIKVDSSHDNFAGILLPKYNVDCDTAVAVGLIVEYVMPQSGHKYNIAISDPSTGHNAGQTVELAAGTAGQFDISAGTIEVVDFLAYTTNGVASTSRFCEVIWA